MEAEDRQHARLALAALFAAVRLYKFHPSDETLRAAAINDSVADADALLRALGQ